MQKKMLLTLILLFLCLGVYASSAAAFGASFPDARSAAMGSTGVATDPRNAVFFNPSLSATGYEEYDWYAMVPSYHKLVADPDNLENSLKSFSTAADDYLNNSSPANDAKVRNTLAAMKDKYYRQRNATTLLLGVPSRIVGGAFYISKYQVFSAQPRIGTPDLSTNPVNYNSTIDYLGVDVSEMGFSGALPLTTRVLGIGDFKLGGTLKLMLIDGISYSQSVTSAKLKLNSQGAVDTASTFNFDVGVSKAVGVWKFGLALKNAVNETVNLGDSGKSYTFKPLVRAGMAYRSRRTYFEVDADVLKSQQFGLEKKSQFARVGWEHRLLSWLFLRAGAEHDFGGDNLSTLTYGLGVDINGVEIDAAAINNKDENGFYAQLTFKI
jgi:hypothetical protein